MVAPNTSATGGYLQPNPPPAPAPLEGRSLLRFLQQYIASITGLPGDMVRPRWQAEPPNIPNAGDAWLAMGVVTRKSDTFPYVGENDTPEGGEAELQNHEVMSILCSFYDLGAEGLADDYAERLRDGLQIAQNREPLFLAGMGLVDTSDLVAVPVIVKTRWLYRVDMTVRIRRAVIRTYPVRTILQGTGTVEGQPEGTDIVITQNFDAPSNP